MARYKGGVWGSRDEVTRLGSANSGFKAWANGWELGGIVEMYDVDGTDKVTIHLTDGSSRRCGSRFLGTFTTEDLLGKIDVATVDKPLEVVIEVDECGDVFVTKCPETVRITFVESGS